MPDLNLLIALDVLLEEGSVARAARRLQLSPSAMSRTLQRLRDATGDPLLVRAGRGLLPTPRAVALREQVKGLVQAAEQVLRPAALLDPAQVSRRFVLLCSDGFVENFGPPLLDRLRQAAPGIRLDFLPKVDRDTRARHESEIDLETAVVGRLTAQQLRVRALFRDRFVGVVSQSHPLASGEVTLARYLACEHVADSRHGMGNEPVDRALQAQGASRRIVTSVGGFAAALALARHSGLVATVPERHSGNLQQGMFAFALPLALPPFTVSMLWHGRLEGDPVHQWLRAQLLSVCQDTPPSLPVGP